MWDSLLRHPRYFFRPSGNLRPYIELLKPRVTILLTFLGVSSAIIASKDPISEIPILFIIGIAILLGSGGANGLTNYLDRFLDTRMQRTKGRSLPSKRIFPHYRGLIWAGLLVFIGIIIAFSIHPYAAMAGITGTLSSVIFRKTEATHFLGGVSSAAPIAVGWLAIQNEINLRLIILCIFVAVWVIHHVWAIMLFYQNDYIQAGVNIFPLRSKKEKVLPLFILLAIIAGLLTVLLGLINDANLYFYAGCSFLNIYNLWGTTQLNNTNISNSIQRKRFKTASYTLLIAVFTALLFI
jgi:protoheme IX farnesyltransferase